MSEARREYLAMVKAMKSERSAASKVPASPAGTASRTRRPSRIVSQHWARYESRDAHPFLHDEE